MKNNRCSKCNRTKEEILSNDQERMKIELVTKKPDKKTDITGHRLIRTILPCKADGCRNFSNRECHYCEHHCETDGKD